MDNNGTEKEESLNNKTTYRILSLDGGGIRGLVTAVWLQRLEEVFGSPIKDHFNLIAGTSTGSILACGLSLGIPATKLIEVYKKRGREIFPQSPISRALKYVKHLGIEGLDQPIYSDQGLKKVLQDEFGDKKFGCLYSRTEKDKKVSTFVTSYDTLNRKVVCFNSSQNRYAEIPIWEVCKASSSAPIFFPAHLMEMKNGDQTYKIPLIDGGVVASNPTACAIAEGLKALDESKRDINLVVVSLGTGDSNRPIHIKQAQNRGVLEWALNITGVLFDGVSQAVEHIASSMVPQTNYFRFQAKLEEDSLDDVSEENLNALQAFANSYFDTKICKEKIKDLKKAFSTRKWIELADDGFCSTSFQNGQNSLNTQKCDNIIAQN